MMSLAIFLVSDESMKPDDIDIHRVNGIGSSTSPSTNYSYIVFCQSRCGNLKFYKLILEVVLINFVKDIRNSLTFLERTIPVWFQLDGEAIQLKPLFESETLFNGNKQYYCWKVSWINH